MSEEVRRVIKLRPDPHCEFCDGRGTVTDWVDYGSTTVPMESTCDCVLEQIDQEDDAQYEIDDEEYWDALADDFGDPSED